jgi:protein-S-isoprenylcysteine O-methyltransferase Ste14
VKFPKPYADFVQRLRVPAGFVLAALFAWLAEPDWPSLAVGLSIALLGLALRAWAAGYLEKNQSLAIHGPYAHLRNPLYAGTLLAGAGFAIAARSPVLGALMAAAFLLVYLPAIQLEQEHLAELFPNYAEYARSVPLLLPKFRADRGGQRFRWKLYLRNQEYNAALGFLAGALLLAVKAWLR